MSWIYRAKQYNNDDFFDDFRIERRLRWLPFLWFSTGKVINGRIAAMVFVGGMNG